MNISQLSEQLKDVPQNRLVDYAQNPNSVVPQFLALAEIQRRQQLSAQAQPPASTVANDVLSQAAPQADPALLRAAAMQQQAPQQASQQMPQAQQMAQQLPENQPGVAQLPTGMPQGMAAGGIVAFGDGGLSLDEDEEDDREMARLFPQASASRFQEILAALPVGVSSGIRGIADKGSQAVQAVKAALPQSYEAAKASQAATSAAPRGSHKYEAAVLEEAKRQGVDPNLALHVLYKETGNLKDPESARSKAGALGVMQLMPKTAAGLGVNPLDPMENIRGGITYLKQMHSKYGDPRTAAAAYNAGPGNVDKALKRQGGLDTLSGETRNYIAGLSQGGKIEHFATGDEVRAAMTDRQKALDVVEQNLPDTPSADYAGSLTNWMESPQGIKQLRDRQIAMEAIKNNVTIPQLSSLYQAYAPKTIEQVRQERAVVPVAAVPTKTSADALKQTPGEANRYSTISDIYKQTQNAPTTAFTPSTENYDIGFGPNKYAPEKAPEGPAPLTEAQQYAQELRDSIKAQAAEAAQNKKMQLGLSLLGAGAAGLQSRSPYMLEGLGAGLAGGVSTFGALKKQEADEAKNILAARLGLYKIGAAEEGAKETREQNKIIKDITLAQNKKAAEAQDYNTKLARFQTLDNSIRDQVMAPYKNNELFKLQPEKFEAKIQADLAAARQNNELYKILSADLGVPIKPIATSGPVIVQTPKGAISFPSQAAADEFKLKAGIK